MRRKIFFGLMAVTIGAIVAGDYLFSRSSGAQEPLKKAEPEKKSDDLFELLKKDLEKPKVVLPALPMAKTEESFPPPVVQVQAPGQLQISPPLVIPPPTAAKPEPVGPLPPITPPGSPSVAPVPGASPNPLPPPARLQAEDKKSGPLPPPLAIAPNDVKPAPPAPIVPSDVKPAIGTDSTPLPPPIGSAPAVDYKTIRIADTKTTAAKLKTSPWTVHVEIVEEQTIVTLSVNKRHEFKILCQHLDLQTAQNTLKATGKVKIDGDSLRGSCENLLIRLYDDRLVLEGAGELRVFKGSANDGFELTGDKLTLRIAELEKSKFIETSWRRTREETVEETVPTVKAATLKQWSPYGKLRLTKLDHDGQAVYVLEGNDGQPIVHLVGTTKSLTAYVGRTISVYGTTIEPSPSGSLLRVSHIAVP